MPSVTMAAHPPDASESPLKRYSRWALAVTAACMPLYVGRFHIGPLPTSPLEVLIVITVGLWAANRFTTRDWHVPRTSLDIPIAVLLIAGIVGIAVSSDHTGALGLYRAYFIEPVVLFYVAVDVLRKREDFRLVLAAFVFGATVFAIGNLGAWVIAVARHVDIDLGNAPKFLYTSPNSVALFLEPPIALAAGFALYASERRERIAALVCLPVLLVSEVATLSRGGFLTMAVLALVAVLTLPSLRLKLALLGTVVLGGLATLLIPPVLKRLQHQFDPSYPYNTFEGRLQIWRDSLHMLRDHPIFGAGLRNYANVMRPYVTTPTGLPELYPHNIFLDFWAELGLLGLAAFVVLIALLLWRGWSSYSKAEGFAKALLWGTAAAFVGIVVHGQVDTPYYNNDLSVEFWIVAALEIAAIRALVMPSTGKTGLVR